MRNLIEYSLKSCKSFGSFIRIGTKYDNDDYCQDIWTRGFIKDGKIPSPYDIFAMCYLTEPNHEEQLKFY
jgi:hypothetical protein